MKTLRLCVRTIANGVAGSNCKAALPNPKKMVLRIERFKLAPFQRLLSIFDAGLDDSQLGCLHGTARAQSRNAWRRAGRTDSALGLPTQP